MVVVRKQKDIRICTNFTALNKYVVREQYLLPTVEEAITSLRNAKHFSELDCIKGFWQIKLNRKRPEVHNIYHTIWKIRVYNVTFRYK